MDCNARLVIVISDNHNMKCNARLLSIACYWSFTKSNLDKHIILYVCIYCSYYLNSTPSPYQFHHLKKSTIASVCYPIRSKSDKENRFRIWERYYLHITIKNKIFPTCILKNKCRTHKRCVATPVPTLQAQVPERWKQCQVYENLRQTNCLSRGI